LAWRPVESSVRAGDTTAFLSDWATSPGARLDLFGVRFLAVAALFALFRLYLSGGLIESFRPQGSGRLSELLACSTRHFFPLVRLAVVFLVPLAVVGAAYWSMDVGRGALFLNRPA